MAQPERPPRPPHLGELRRRQIVAKERWAAEVEARQAAKARLCALEVAEVCISADASDVDIDQLIDQREAMIQTARADLDRRKGREEMLDRLAYAAEAAADSIPFELPGTVSVRVNSDGPIRDPSGERLVRAGDVVEIRSHLAVDLAGSGRVALAQDPPLWWPLP